MVTATKKVDFHDGEGYVSAFDAEAEPSRETVTRMAPSRPPPRHAGPRRAAALPPYPPPPRRAYS